MVKKKSCINCGRKISLSNYNKHVNSCNLNKQTFKVNEEWKQKSGLYRCPYCGKEYAKKGICTHIWTKHIEEGIKHNKRKLEKARNKRQKTSNQYIKAKEEGNVYILSKESRLKISKTSIINSKKQWSYPENRKKHSTVMKNAVKKYPESYSANNVSGRVKTFEYNGFKLKGTWELDVTRYLDKNDIKWTNIFANGFDYMYNNEFHLYFPDFYLLDYDIYIEVKGYERERDRAKWKYFPYKLFILKHNEINKIQNNTFDILEYINNEI